MWKNFGFQVRQEVLSEQNVDKLREARQRYMAHQQRLQRETVEHAARLEAKAEAKLADLPSHSLHTDPAVLDRKRQVIEAALFVRGGPLTAKKISHLVRGSFDAGFVEQAVVGRQRRVNVQVDAAVRIADTLSRNVQPGDADRSPWPFRVHAATGEVFVSDKGRFEYTTNWTGALRLFDALVSMGKGRVADHERARQLVSDWLRAYPLSTQRWGPFFEDINIYSDTQINAGTMALYILEHPSWIPDGQAAVRRILDWANEKFGNPTWSRYGVLAANEQTAYEVPGNSHTSREASLELLWAEAAGDATRKAQAIRNLNWATYMVDTDGKNRYYHDDVWLTDGYGTDPEATFLVNEREIWFVPVVNPDGYVWNEVTDPSGGGLWRKNRRDNPSTCEGVDINRNYGYQWGGSGASPDECDETYRGTAAWSEPETRAVRDFVSSRRFVTADSYHSNAALVLYPWGYTVAPPPDSGSM